MAHFLLEFKRISEVIFFPMEISWHKFLGTFKHNFLKYLFKKQKVNAYLLGFSYR